MFWRILWRLLWASRSRLALALVAVASGAAVCAALVNLDLDASDKLTREFRSLGANVVVSPAQTANTAATMDSGVMDRIDALHAPEIIAAAPYLVRRGADGRSAGDARSGDRRGHLVRSGCPDQFLVERRWAGEFPSATIPPIAWSASEVARSLGLVPGSQLTLRYAGREATFTVAGVLTAGGSEDSQVFRRFGGGAESRRPLGAHWPGAAQRARLGAYDRKCDPPPCRRAARSLMFSRCGSLRRPRADCSSAFAGCCSRRSR